MRCSRCNRPAVPQAVGRSPEGLVVFGWCVPCLEETGCTDIEIARTKVGGPELESAAREVRQGTGDVERLLLQRRRAAILVAGLMGLWSIALLAAGGWFALGKAPRPASPLGNGMPFFFFGGGAAVGIVALALSLALYREWIGRVCRDGRWVGAGSFVVALTILCAGIAVHNPRLDPLFVAAAALCLLVSVIAIRRERQRIRPGAAPLRTRSKHAPNEPGSGHRGS